jgi:Mu transposase-like protein
VAHDALVDVDTVRYSVPYRLVRQYVEVRVGDTHVQIYAGAECVATHRRAQEPHARIVDPAHYEGLWRPFVDTGGPASPPVRSSLSEMGRSLDEYAAVIGGER